MRTYVSGHSKFFIILSVGRAACKVGKFTAAGRNGGASRPDFFTRTSRLTLITCAARAVSLFFGLNGAGTPGISRERDAKR